MPQTAPQATPNGTTFDELLQHAADLGAQAGKGGDTQIKFMLQAFQGGFHNAVDLAPNKHGTDIDDATKLAEVYVKAQTGSTIFNAKAPNQRKLISTLRTGIKLGHWPKGGHGEPLATVNNLMTKRQKLKQNPATAKKLDDAVNVLMKYARTQLKRDTLIDDTELETFCYRKDPELLSAEEHIEKITKQLDKLIDGTASQGTVQDTSIEIKDARQFLRKRLSAIATARGKALGPNGTRQIP